MSVYECQGCGARMRFPGKHVRHVQKCRAYQELTERQEREYDESQTLRRLDEETWG